ncbi:MAG: TetR/AcrR family transcriptional regulator [Desulfomonilaceae bacterium]|nr:TetR/AcrR family transcriptional regulator [Desulfomonilaceae bacterium]
MSTSPITGTRLFRSLAPEKRDKVFRAAVREFASKGYRNASMNSVVKVARISKGSLFQYFRTKRDLFDGVVEMAVIEVKNYLKQVREDTNNMSFFDRLSRLIRAGFEFIDNHPLLARIYFHLIQSGETPFGVERMLQLHKLSDEFMADLIRDAIGRGEIRSDLDVERVAFLVNSLMETLLRAYYTEFMASGLGLYRGDGAELDRWIETFLELVSRGMEVPRDAEKFRACT